MTKTHKPGHPPKLSHNPRSHMVMQQRRSPHHPRPRMHKKIRTTRWFATPRFFLGAGLLLCVGLFFFFRDDVQTYFQKELILIDAHSGPIKIRPDNTGDLSTPHREKTIYKSLEEGGLTVGEEKILKSPEEPIMQTPALSENFFESFGASDEPSTTSEATDTDHSAHNKERVPSSAFSVLMLHPLELNGSSSLAPVRYYLHLKSPTSMEEVNSLARRIQSIADVGPLISLYEKKAIMVDKGRSLGVDYRLEIGPLSTLEEGRILCHHLAPYGCQVVAQKN
ncbi:MAG: hypothetical protein K2X53_01225 [Alphaproteobacteria bacterium]|nr:hypothetical protein [Alphaproteobacteria bacterium]